MRLCQERKDRFTAIRTSIIGIHVCVRLDRDSNRKCGQLRIISRLKTQSLYMQRSFFINLVSLSCNMCQSGNKRILDNGVFWE